MSGGAAGVAVTGESAQLRAGKRKRARGRGRPKERYNRRETLAGILFISPWIIGFLVFTAGAMVYSLVISFSDYNLATGAIRPVGTANYEQLFTDPRIPLALGNTFFFVLLSVPLELAVALGLALLLDRLSRGTAFFRILLYLPKMTPAVATAAMFFPLLNGNSGAVNQFLGFFGIQGPQWLIDPDWVKPSIVLMGL